MRVAVLGAGLQGSCVALELARHGFEVDLFDRNDRCLSQASAQNEGKIHLGYVYGNDPSLRTARLMVRGALSFAPLMRTWIGDAIDRVPVSTPFHYVVHRESLLSADQVERHLQATHQIARAQLNGDADAYFGIDLAQSPERIDPSEHRFASDRVAAVFMTPEIAIDPEALAAAVRQQLDQVPGINCVLNAEIVSVDSTATNRMKVDFVVDSERQSRSYDHVVNTLWDGRLAIDATLGIHPDRPWLFRTKYFLRLQGAPDRGAVPSATIVLGAFGDVVHYANGALYLSWYPAGMRQTTGELSPGDSAAALDADTAAEIRHSIVARIAEIVPEVSAAIGSAIDGADVKGGVIFAYGQSDISDPASELHQRHDVGVHSYGRYHSIDTGKLTLAPLFAKEAADHIRAA